MRLYHYRSIKNAVIEIEKGTFHFAKRDELNDPIEGYVRVYWKGDKAAWEGLLRNYICSLSKAISFYLLGVEKDELRYKSLMVDIGQFDNVPLGQVLKQIGDTFLLDEEIQKLATYYGDSNLKVYEDELKVVLHFIHKKALLICIRSDMGSGIIPKEQGDSLLKIFSGNDISFPFDLMEAEFVDEKERTRIMKCAYSVIKDAEELYYMKLKPDAIWTLSDKDNIKESQYKKWMSIAVDFPQMYTEQLKEMLYPESYVVCFSKNNDNSSMWGNYADNHKGVCIIYETLENNKMSIINKGRHDLIEAKNVCYGGELLECNFYESFGRLTYKQIALWLTGSEGVSKCFASFSDRTTWRENYWRAYEAKTYRKLDAWSHEEEYRLSISNTFYEYNNPGDRNLMYDINALKGIIFGINTTEYDKKLIMEALMKKTDVLNDFKFYQAEYDAENQKIVIREKNLWKI